MRHQKQVQGNGADGMPVALLPGRLAWVPGLARGRESSSNLPHPYKAWHQLRMLDYEDHVYLRGGMFSVPHYPVDAVAKAYGPLALDQVLSFCLVLQQALDRHGSVVVATEAESVQERANVAVLVGAYLILKLRWTAEQVAEKLVVEAKMAFPCCWYRRRPMGDVMLISDCWAGIQLARTMQWIDAQHIGDEPFTNMLCSQYRRTLLQYDIAWISPGEVCVGADPITVIHDPKPTTCKALTPLSKGTQIGVQTGAPQASIGAYAYPKLPGAMSSKSLGSRKKDTLFGDDDTATTTDGSAKLLVDAPDSDARSEASTVAAAPADIYARVNDQFGDIGGPSDGSSCHTVCKDYAGNMDVLDAAELPETVDFVTWCKMNTVALVVRMNLNDEPGIEDLGGSYSAHALEEHGLAHYHFGMEDHDGATPMPDCLRQVFAECEAHKDEGATLFHCKGGFGRSVMMACCYLIYKHNISGRALFGWVRMARPGAITTPQQERFLCRLRGKADLVRYMKEDIACCTVS
mmetsp:Transcript_6438/g.15628  ORF Transcript_6438/g.15628 Transcript_6438/m.15628 type:complete len:519 (+) Transcript_6438:56-1612(+)